MTEQEKRAQVIHGLECCLEGLNEMCGYADSDAPGGCKDRLMLDALELLKAQEAAEPEIEVLNEIDRIYRCPSCHKSFFYKKQRFCDSCGQAVKWE